MSVGTLLISGHWIAFAIHLLTMKNAVIPQVRVDAALRSELEQVLQADESITEFVEAAVRRAIEHRRVQSSFDARGEAALLEFRRTGESVPAEDVLQMLQARLDARRRALAKG